VKPRATKRARPVTSRALVVAPALLAPEPALGSDSQRALSALIATPIANP
jgi:hypothetical protein